MNQKELKRMRHKTKRHWNSNIFFPFPAALNTWVKAQQFGKNGPGILSSPKPPPPVSDSYASFSFVERTDLTMDFHPLGLNAAP